MVKNIHKVVSSEFEAINHYIVEQLRSTVPLVEDISHYIVDAGGKRIRPALVLLSSKSCGYEQEEHIKLATVIEFLHTATLLHDDVVDVSDMRRGNPSANVFWDNASSVLVGDFIYSRAFQILVSLGNIDIMKIIADTTNKIAEGEVLQLANIHNTAATEDEYMTVIRNKTAILFQAAAHTGAILASAKGEQQQALKDFGMHVGMAFQLIDDVLDYSGESQDLGKNVGDDLAEGKPTLPLIYAMKHGSSDQRTIIEEAIRHGGIENLEQIIHIVSTSGALQYTHQLAQAEVDNALNCLEAIPASPYRDALMQMAQLAVDRTS